MFAWIKKFFCRRTTTHFVKYVKDKKVIYSGNIENMPSDVRKEFVNLMSDADMVFEEANKMFEENRHGI